MIFAKRNSIMYVCVGYNYASLTVKFFMYCKKKKKNRRRRRSSRSEMFFKIGTFKYFAIFTGNTCVGVSF